MTRRKPASLVQGVGGKICENPPLGPCSHKEPCAKQVKDAFDMLTFVVRHAPVVPGLNQSKNWKTTLSNILVQLTSLACFLFFRADIPTIVTPQQLKALVSQPR